VAEENSAHLLEGLAAPTGVENPPEVVSRGEPPFSLTVVSGEPVHWTASPATALLAIIEVIFSLGETLRRTRQERHPKG